MIDEYSGLKIRKTMNGMRKEDKLDAPPQHKRVLEKEEIVDILVTAPQRDHEGGEE